MTMYFNASFNVNILFNFMLYICLTLEILLTPLSFEKKPQYLNQVIQ